MRLYTPLILASTADGLKRRLRRRRQDQRKEEEERAPLVEKSEAYAKLRKWATAPRSTACARATVN